MPAPFLATISEAWADWLVQTLESLRALGWAGAAVFVLLYVALSAVFLPASLLTLGAGAVYGWGPGALLVAFANTLGAGLCYLASRTFARSWIEKRLETRPRFRGIVHAVSSRGWPLLFISRLSPVFPHSLISYAAGLTRMGAPRFLLASFLGFLPLSTAYAYVGSVVGRLAALRAGAAQENPAASAIWIAGALATILATILTARLVAKALSAPLNGGS